jgi:hypothetical protein
VDPGPFFYIVITVYHLLALFIFSQTTIFYHPICLIVYLQQTCENDNLTVSWSKVLGCVVCRFHVAAGAKLRPRRGAIYKLFRAVAKLASINLWKLVLSPIGSINLGFILREDFLLCSSTFLLGFPTGRSSTRHQANFLAPFAGEKEDFYKGSLSLPIFYFVIVLLYLVFSCILLSKIQKNSSFIVVIFACLLFSLARMSNSEVEVRTFKQQGSESLKDAWNQISNAHHRCTKKHSTMILLRNFYVGISSWNMYVLDTLTGGNFLGTPALEACTLIESLVGVPPIHVVKTEVTLDEVF